MRVESSGVTFSATDLSDYLSCGHKTSLEFDLAHGRVPAPAWSDPSADLLRERGLAHEASYVASLRAQGLEVRDLSDLSGAAAVEATAHAMRSGVDAVVQGGLATGRWFGRPDVLRRVHFRTDLGDFGYEPHDAKLAKETRGTTILQLCLYAELLASAQGVTPGHFHVVTPLSDETYRTSDYAAYFRCVKRRLERTVETRPPTYPLPTTHCDVCRWWEACDARRRSDDHLSLVAGMSRRAEGEFESNGHQTLANLGALHDLDFKPTGRKATMERLRSQASIQLEGRRAAAPRFKLLPGDALHGFNRLPLPNANDVFLDLEGDPFVGDSGREFLFGVAWRSGGALQYAGRWALTEAEERTSFEATIDFVMERWRADASARVYHYGSYEAAALKRLVGRHNTRERELDDLLRGKVLVDLLQVVKHALQASVESYSLKALEELVGFRRSLSLRLSSAALALVGRHLQHGNHERLPDQVATAVETYNRDDCLSTEALRNWLETTRDAAIHEGNAFSRPVPPAPQPELVEPATETTRLRDGLLARLPPDEVDHNSEHRALMQLAHLLEFHRREAKPVWWEYFHLKDATDEELFDHPHAAAGLEFVERLAGKRSPVDRFRYPPQEVDLRPDWEAHHRELGKVGTVVGVDREACTIDVRRTRDTEQHHPTSLFGHSYVRTEPQQAALLRLASWFTSQTLRDTTRHLAARALLLREAPRLSAGDLRLEGEASLDQACRVTGVLDRSVLPIQGPPGTGKTFIGAAIICALVRAGKRVGVTANSHAVIRKLLDEALLIAARQRLTLDTAQKVDERSEGRSPIFETTDNAEALDRLRLGSSQVLGGTTWLWASEAAMESVDVLIIDEAGQMAFANALAASQCARSLVLLGDPQQLNQPTRGAHPPGVGVSVLEHMLNGAPTISSERGLFLEHTRRLSPPIARFTSELFYAGRLEAMLGLENQSLDGCPPFTGSGLWFLAVPHQGNTTASVEEVAVVATQVKRLLRKGAWTDAAGVRRRLHVGSHRH